MTDLSAKMRARAKDHPRAHELSAAADAFDAATEGFYAEPQTVSVGEFVGTWAKTRKLWAEISGEPLLSLSIRRH